MKTRFRCLRWFRIAGIATLLCAIALVRDTQLAQSQGQTLWFADHEEPGESDWYYPGFSGGEFNSGCASDLGVGWGGTSFAWWGSLSTPVPPPPNGGNSGLRLTMATSCGGGLSAGTRMFRWAESQKYDDLYYKVWYYFPQTYTLVGSSGWWVILSWKSALAEGNDPFYQIYVYNRPETGNMYLALINWQCRVLGQYCGAGGGRPPRVPGTEEIDVPVNQWFYVEALYKSREDATGAVRVWQNDVLLWDVQDVQTKYTGGITLWGVTNYGSGLDPQPTSIFIDNAEIRTP